MRSSPPAEELRARITSSHRSILLLHFNPHTTPPTSHLPHRQLSARSIQSVVAMAVRPIVGVCAPRPSPRWPIGRPSGLAMADHRDCRCSRRALSLTLALLSVRPLPIRSCSVAAPSKGRGRPAMSQCRPTIVDRAYGRFVFWAPLLTLHLRTRWHHGQRLLV